MEMMKKNGKRIGLLVGVLILAYVAVPFPFLGESARTDVRESAIRWLFRHNHSGQQTQLKVCFIGVGTTFDPQDENFGPQDPPTGFVERFSDFPVPTFPVSASTNAPGGIGGHVADKAGKPGLIFAAGNVRRWSLGFVVCRGLYYEGGLSSAAYDIFILRLPFAWVPVWARMLWIS
jgi:hypothetical protein